MLPNPLLSAALSRLKPWSRRLRTSPLGYRLAAGAFWSLGGALSSRALALLSTILVARILGARGFGELSMLQGTVGLFGTVAGFGLGMSSTKYVAELRRADPPRAGRIITLAALTSWATGAVIGLTLALAAPWVADRTLAAPQLAGLLRLGALLLLLNAVNGAQTGALAGFESFKTIAALNLIAGLCSFPVILLGAWRFGLPGALCALVASAALNCLLTSAALRAEARRHAIPLTARGAWREWPVFLRFNLPGVLNSVLMAFSAWACGAFLAHQPGGYAGLGVLNAAKRVQQLPEALITTALAPMLPVLSEAFARNDDAAARKTVTLAFFIAVLLTLPFALVQIGAPWLTLLPYGATYQGGQPVVQWVILGSIASALLWPLGNIIISLGRMWFAFALILLYTVLFLGLGWLLIPAYGAAGYAAASAAAFILGNIPCVLFLYARLGPVMRAFKWGATLGFTAALALAAFAASRSARPWLGLAIGAAAALAFAAWRIYATVRTARSRPAPPAPATSAPLPGPVATLQS